MELKKEFLGEFSKGTRQTYGYALNSFEKYVNKLPYECSRDEALRILEKNSNYIKL